MISAFRIAVPYTERAPRPPVDDVDNTITIVPVTEHRPKVPAPPRPMEKAPKVLNLDQFKIAEIKGESSPDSNIDQNVVDDTDPFSGVHLPPEIADDTTTWIFVEHKPEPVGGYKAFYQTLNDNIKYPRKAIRYQTTGRVFVEFVIDKTGTPTQVRVTRGIGNGCDEEAIRVVQLTRWNPGKQRGRPVRVKMSLPVTFSLQ